jgi:hypothetical protein
MSLADTKNTLESLAAEAKQLKEKLEGLNGSADTSDADKSKLDGLFAKLAQQIAAAASPEAAEARQTRMQQLDEAIKHIELVLASPAISLDTRDVLKEEREDKLVERARLAGEAGTNFSGVFPAEELADVKQKLLDAQREVQDKKKVAAGIEAALAVADVALTVAGKLGLVL